MLIPPDGKVNKCSYTSVLPPCESLRKKTWSKSSLSESFILYRTSCFRSFIEAKCMQWSELVAFYLTLTSTPLERQERSGKSRFETKANDRFESKTSGRLS